MAHVLTDEAFALSIAHFRRHRPGRRPGLLDRRHRLDVHPVEPGHARRRVLGGQIADPSQLGLDVVFPAAMAGLCVGLITGRRELVAAAVGAAVGVARQPGRRDRASGSSRAASSARWPGCSSRRDGPRAGAARDAPASAERYAMPASPHEPSTTPPGPRRTGAVSVELVLLAVLMGAVTYPSRALPLLAPGIERLPRWALAYLRLVGPAVLAALAAVNVMVVDRPTASRPSTSGSSGWRWSRAIVLMCLAAEPVPRPGGRGGASWPSRAAPGWRLTGSSRRAAQPRRASASISTSSDGSMRPATIDHRRRRPDRRRTARRGPRGPAATAPMSVTNIRVRTTSAEREARLGERPLDDVERGRGLGAGVARMARPAVGPGVGRARHPAGVADDDRPAVAGARLPRAAGRDRASGSPGSRPVRPPRGDERVAGDGEQERREQGRPGHDRVDLEVLGRRVVVAADRAEPVERRHAQPGGRVGVRGAAGRAVGQREAEPLGERRRRARRAGPIARASPSASGGRSPRRRPTSSGTVVRGGDRRGPPPRPPRAASRLVARRSTSRIGLLGHDVRPDPAADDADVAVTPGQRPLSAWSAIAWWAASRIALRPFSGSTPAWAARPWTVRRRSTVPLRADTMSPLARAHSSTKQASASAASSRMCGLELGEPISSSGLATNTSRSNGRSATSSSSSTPSARRASSA